MEQAPLFHQPSSIGFEPLMFAEPGRMESWLAQGSKWGGMIMSLAACALGILNLLAGSNHRISLLLLCLVLCGYNVLTIRLTDKYLCGELEPSFRTLLVHFWLCNIFVFVLIVLDVAQL
ncbi:hypothetical protein HDU91_005623 [Kappamyces sp. JEL0680]|nr:hypothetical protein HDU91_005623 [Kappamyces sp. JEL0680]